MILYHGGTDLVDKPVIKALSLGRDFGETVQAVLDGLMPFDFALQKLAFMPSNNQYCFCTGKALGCLEFIESVELG